MVCRGSWVGRVTLSRLARMIEKSDAVKRDHDAKFIARAHAVTFPLAGRNNGQSVGFNVRIYPVDSTGREIVNEGRLVFAALQGDVEERKTKAITERNRINRWLRNLYRLSNEALENEYSKPE